MAMEKMAKPRVRDAIRGLGIELRSFALLPA
jgi:hypothetical protein